MHLRLVDSSPATPAFSPEFQFPLFSEEEDGQPAGSLGGLTAVAHMCFAGRQHAGVAAAVSAVTREAKG